MLKDKTGPEGKGPTGRGLGSCQNKSKNNTFAGRQCSGQGRGCSRGQGKGRGFGGQFNLSQKDEKSFLEKEIKVFEAQLKLMQNRLDELN